MQQNSSRGIHQEPSAPGDRSAHVCDSPPRPIVSAAWSDCRLHHVRLCRFPPTRTAAESRLYRNSFVSYYLGYRVKIGEVDSAYVCFQHYGKENIYFLNAQNTTVDPNPNTIPITLTLTPTPALPIELCPAKKIRVCCCCCG